MRGPTTTASSTQSTFIANKSKPHIQSFFASNLKKTTNNYPPTTKVTQQEILHDPVDQNNQKTIKKGTSAILPSSKTIQKVTSSRLALSKLALENLNKFYNNRTPSTNAVSKPKSLSIPLGPKTFIEDGIKKTRNYVTLTYLSTKYRKTKEFYCFHDRDLKVPSEFSQKTIKHTCDNDCTTDEEQIKGGVKSLYKALQTYLEEEKTGKKRRPWMKDMVSSYWCLYNGIK